MGNLEENVRKIPPFYPNESDNKHCFHSSFRMIYEYFSGTPIDVAAVEEITNFQPGRANWPFAGMLFFADNEFEVHNIEQIDIPFYINDMHSAMAAQFGKEAADKIAAKTDMRREVDLIKSLNGHESVKFFIRIPTVKDIIDYVRDGWLVLSSVNYYALLGEQRYNGHFVVIYGVDDKHKTITLHNPGLPPIESQVVSFNIMERAMYSPTPETGNLIAIRKIR